MTLDEKRGAGFYNLIYLNLAHNMIADEEAVVHTSELRNLRKLILYGNPLAHAAVTSYDPTKLAYDPVPSLTAILNERPADQIAMTIVVAYPATKKKKLHSMSCYEHVEIYKMIPNEVVLQSPFRTRTTEFCWALIRMPLRIRHCYQNDRYVEQVSSCRWGDAKANIR